ncbi:MAG: hypothetical protein RL106_2032, partial [Bacteroidota bacterium]
PDVVVEEYEIDSRKINWGAKTLFIAIPTRRSDGHFFVLNAKERGVKCVLAQKEMDLDGVTQIVVNDTVHALQTLAAHHRSRFDVPVLAITGSNGKTIVKEWLNQLCAGHFRICRSPRSYNSQLGVPLSILQMNDEHTLAIIEAGISQPGEMQRLQEIIRPNCGIFTHLGEAHLSSFESQQNLFEEKEKLFAGAQWIVANQKIKLQSGHSNYLSWGANSSNDWVVSIENHHMGNVVVKVNEHFFTLPFDIPFLIDNACSAICSAMQLGVPIDEIQSKVQKLSVLEMRMEQLQGVEETVLYNDAYSLDIPSLKLAIEEVNRHPKNQQRILVLSELPEGNDADIDYARVAEMITQYNWENVFLVGSKWERFESSFSFPYQIFQSTKLLLQSLNNYTWKGQVVLVKGARAFGFEGVIQRLQARNHITCLEINLNAIRSNLNFYRDKLNPGVKTMVMVKAFGYGAGSVEIAEWLAFNRVDYLGVAYVDEGIALREGGISVPIMVMNPEEFSVRAMMQYNLEPEIYSINVLMHMLQQKDALGLEQKVRIHIKVDTGMRRLGFDLHTLEEALQILKQRSDIEVHSIMSHLASAEDEHMDRYTQMQLDLFDLMLKRTQSFFPAVLSHISNTSGIVRWPQAQYDMVRLGIGMYGYSPVESEQMHLQNVHRWTTHISQIREIEAHDFVGYGCSFEATQKMRIATLPVGYADGLKRILSNGRGAVEISGQLAPIVGRVCMDMTMVDVTNISCTEGDEAILLGGKITLKKLAEECSTIPYEVLTSISNRVKRKFIKE